MNAANETSVNTKLRVGESVWYSYRRLILIALPLPHIFLLPPHRFRQQRLTELGQFLTQNSAATAAALEAAEKRASSLEVRPETVGGLNRVPLLSLC